MIRFIIDSTSTALLEKIKELYKFPKDTIVARIALALSIQNGKHLLEKDPIPSDGREYTPTSNVFGKYIHNEDNFVIYKTIFDKHYNQDLSERDFINLFKQHLKDGLEFWDLQLTSSNIMQGKHISFLLEYIEKGLDLRNSIKVASSSENINIDSYNELLTFKLGINEDGEDVIIRINDETEFDSRHIAIAGMSGSGKTQLIKDILYQISNNTDHKLKFIYFDYKGEGNKSDLKSFLDSTKCEFVDIIEDEGIKFNPLSFIGENEKYQSFNIKTFTDTIATFVPGLGVVQQHRLRDILYDLFKAKKESYPTTTELFDHLKEHYENNRLKQDILYSIISDLDNSVFNCAPQDNYIFSQSKYVNLPSNISDTVRQLVVFLILRYLHNVFLSTNDCIPQDKIAPLRYVIVIDEAHIYLQNNNASKALEEMLRQLRSKGIIIVMLSQGVEDYKTKDFDFSSQVKLPICLNIKNKEYKNIQGFIGTPKSKLQLETKINALDSGKALINIDKPQIITLRQWWKTQEEENL